MTTVGEAIDRIESDFLHPAGANLPPFDLLASTLTVGATSMTVAGLQTYSPQQIVQIGSELILTKKAETTTSIDLNERGFRESTAAEHASGTKVWFDPEFYRVSIFNHIASIVSGLYGKGLYRVQETTALTISTVNDVTLPAGAIQVVDVMYEERSGDAYVLDKDAYQVLPFSTPRVKFRGGREGATATILYTSDFTAPDTEARDLTSYCGVPSSLADDIPMAAAARLLLGKDVPRTFLEENQEESEQTGVSLSISDIFERKFEQRIAEEKRKLRMRFGI